MIKGVVNVIGTKRKPPRQQLTFNLLDSIIPFCDKSFDETCVKTALCVAFAAFLRGGDFTYPAWTAVEQATKPSRSSIKFREGYATLTLPQTKTERHKPTIVKLLETHRSSCPVTALKDLFTRFPAPGHAPLFARRHPLAPFEDRIYGCFNREYFGDMMRDLLLRAGINPEGFSNHSIRRGAAQSAADAGLTKSEIQTLGRWKSNAVLRYVTPATAKALAQRRASEPLIDGAPIASAATWGGFGQRLAPGCQAIRDGRQIPKSYQ
jgi:integrase